MLTVHGRAEWTVCIHAAKAVEDFVQLPNTLQHVVLFDSDAGLGVDQGRITDTTMVSTAINVMHKPGVVSVYFFGELNRTVLIASGK